MACPCHDKEETYLHLWPFKKVLHRFGSSVKPPQPDYKVLMAPTFFSRAEWRVLLKAACWIWPLQATDLGEWAVWQSSGFKQLANSCLCSEENTMRTSQN